MRKYIFLTILVVSTSVTCFAQKEVRSSIREGNRLYNQEAYLDSEINYRRALDVNPVDSIATFNLGNALYRQQDEEKIKEAYNHYISTAQRASSSGNKDLAAKSLFNAGDIMMASQQYDKAIQLFKQSLKNNPADNEARYNLLLAQKLLQQNEQNQDQQNQDQQEDKQQDKQDQQQQNQQDQQNQDQQENQQQQEEQQQNQISQDQAEAILNANNRDETDTQQKVQEKLMQQVKRKQTDRDW